MNLQEEHPYRQWMFFFYATFCGRVTVFINTFLPQKGCIREHPKPRYFLRACVSIARRISLWGEGKRKRFPLQPFAGDLFVVYLATKNQGCLLQTISWFLFTPHPDLLWLHFQIVYTAESMPTVPFRSGRYVVWQ